ncbi:succinate dehydrogenase assembly factor 2 [Limnobacter sp. 130]|jgi:antitoxin CptB|uniref:FAD assembly factor SdhE n=1 Tax=unclassified Limnobacter TaxID=2630203 RepID=UPI0012F44607|nr:succinate dehydrogenase assembly factor 2 [Limnobacter sp. 130]VWX33944.1 FAD assembly factor SdhE [Limnobacter sp. 130]
MANQSHQADPTQRARLRWRARRGLLENDLIIERFFDKHEMELTDDDVQALTVLFEEVDNVLLDLFLGRKELEGSLDTPDVRRVVQMMREL